MCYSHFKICKYVSLLIKKNVSPQKYTNYIYELNVKEEVFFMAGQESRECCVFISDVGD